MIVPFKCCKPKCGRVWLPRSTNTPKKCPRCKCINPEPSSFEALEKFQEEEKRAVLRAERALKRKRAKAKAKRATAKLKRHGRS